MDTRPPPADLVVSKRRPRQAVPARRASRRSREERPASSPTPHPPPVSVDELCARWRSALDTAASALRAACDLPAAELTVRRNRLAGERTSTLELLRALAKERGASTRFLQLAPRADARRLLGLPSGIEACIFNLDGVLIGSAAVHATAWTQTFDELIWARTERTHGTFAPFNPVVDYPRYLHGRPRLDGVRTFLASRGIRLSEGASSDPAGAETVHGLATRKNEILRRRVDDQGVAAFAGVAHYLELAGEAGIRRAVVSASANTQTLLHRSGLESLVDCRIDGNTMAAERLRAKPAPDTLLAACRALEVEPGTSAVFEDSVAGVEAARAAGVGFVVGVDRGGHADALRDRGADVVVSDLGDLLAPA